MSVRFVIEKQISARKSADAFVALDTQTNTKVRILRIHSPLTGVQLCTIEDAVLVTKHQLSNIQSDYVLNIVDTGIDENGAWIVTPLLGSQQLTTALELPLAPDELHSLATQFLQGIQRIHEKNMVHGALSINSLEVIVNEDSRNHYIITDLGMRQLLILAQNEQALESLPSDLPTLAPELFQDREATPQTDLYMAGQIFYYLLAGGHPMVGLSTSEALNKHVTHELPLLNTINLEISNRIAKWVDSLIQAAPEKRPLSALAALHDLEEISKTPIHQQAKKKVSTSTSSNKKTFPLIVCALLLLSLGCVAYYLFSGNDSTPLENQTVKGITISPHLQGSVEGGTLRSTTKFCSIGSNNSSKKEAWGTKKSNNALGPDLGSTWRAFLVYKISDIISKDSDDDITNISDLTEIELKLTLKADPIKYGRKTRTEFAPLLHYAGNYSKTTFQERRDATRSVTIPLLKPSPDSTNGSYTFILPKMDLSKLSPNDYLFFVLIANHPARKDESMTFLPSETKLEIIKR